MKNSQILNTILTKVEEKHINLYHSVSKNRITNFVNKIPNIDSLSDLEFDLEMLKLFALFKDGHTSYFVKNLPLEHKIIYLNNKVHINKEGIYFEVLKVNGVKIKQVLKLFCPLLNSETEAWKDVLLEKALNNGYFYQMNKLAENYVDFEVKYENSITNIKMKIPTFEEAMEIFNRKNGLKSYEFRIIDDSILYLKYRACRNDRNLSFENFVNNIKEEIIKKNIKKFVLDLRDNIGGNSRVVTPFDDLVKEQQLDGVILINRKVYSSAVLAVAKFKKDYNLKIIGEQTGGPCKSYGEIESFDIETKRVSYSVKLFDLTDVFGYTGSIQPDIYVSLDIEDLKANKDRQLEVAIEMLKTK